MKSIINSLFIIISWSLLLSHCVVVGFSLNTEGEALLSLQTKFFFGDGTYYGKLEGNYSIGFNFLNWNNLSSPCDGWVGVSCNTEKTHVVSLNLLGYNISGQLGPQIGQLTYLEVLDLNMNRFNGSIPIELWNCSHLQYLDLTVNHFTGEFPHESTWNLHQLKTFLIDDNQFSGSIPEYLFHNSVLEYVYFTDNNFTGSIPVNIGNATNMKELDLRNNQLHGNIPASLSNCTKLKSLRLGRNSLSGEIPLGVWRIPTLDYMDVSFNNLSGELPLEMTELRRLSSLSLNNNQFFGSIPKDLGINHTTDWSVDFSNNAFTGEIPPNLCFGQKLLEMRFDQNQFHGNIPSAYTQNCVSLSTLSLRGNKLTGSLSEFDQINSPRMQYLDLSRNNIQGQIPSSICSLHFIDSLDLSENQMNGTLPHCFGRINRLSQLNLRSNNFSGTIPRNFTSNLINLDLNGNRFEGKINFINSPNLKYLDLGNNQFNDTFPSFLGEHSSNLEILVLRSNKLYGPLPKQFPASGYLPFRRLKILDISSNYFSGNFPSGFILGLDDMKNIDKNDTVIPLFPDLFSSPTEVVHAGNPDRIAYYRVSTVIIYKGKESRLNDTIKSTFRAIDMSNNKFQGSIPESMGQLLLLTSLNFSDNNLNGRIPSSLGKLKQLQSLDLSKNKLFGEIPGQLTNLNFLAVLNLSYNHLTGPIPTTGQFPSFPDNSFVGNPGLCGIQSSTGCLRREDPVAVEKESDEDSNSWNFGWEPVAIGYGCGALVGLVLQYFIFTKAFLYRWFG